MALPLTVSPGITIFKSFDTTNLTDVFKTVNVYILQKHHLHYQKKYPLNFLITYESYSVTPLRYT